MGLEDDIVYLKILFFTFFASYFIKRMPCSFRDLVSAILGIGTISIVCGGQLFYSMVMVLVNIGLIKMVPSKPLVNFIFCFAYLTFFRCAHLICEGGYFPKYLPHINAVQLIMTLRCVGLAFELSDQRKEKHQQMASKEKNTNSKMGDVHFAKLSDDPLRMFYYCYNLVGVFTGPYYSYRVHQDMAKCKYLHRIPFSSQVITKLMAVPLLITLFLLIEKASPIEAVHTDEFYLNNYFLARLLYSVPVFAHCRIRCYIAWMISEASCIVSGIGAYPQISKPKIGSGPSDLGAYRSVMEDIENQVSKSATELDIEFDFETVHNIDIYGCEFKPTFRESMRCWNRSVQYWLATYIYRRCPWKAMRTSATMLVSAYWHGVHAGYYLSFMTIPLCLYAEDLAFSFMESKSMENKKFRLYWWFYRTRGFEYMVMGFLLLSWTSTIRYWASTGFFLHTSLIVMILIFSLKKYVFRGTKDKVE